MDSYLAVVGGVVAGAAIGLIVLYVAWRLFLRDYSERRKSARSGREDQS